MFFFFFLKIREKHSDCNLTNLTYSYHFRSKSETTTDLFSFVKVRQNFEDTKFILLKIVKILKFLQYSRDGSQVHRANMHNPLQHIYLFHIQQDKNYQEVDALSFQTFGQDYYHSLPHILHHCDIQTNMFHLFSSS